MFTVVLTNGTTIWVAEYDNIGVVSRTEDEKRGVVSYRLFPWHRVKHMTWAEPLE